MEKQPKKREEKEARKQAEQEVKSDDEDLDYSSNEEAELERRESLQRVEPRVPRTFEEKQSAPRLIVILEYA